MNTTPQGADPGAMPASRCTRAWVFLLIATAVSLAADLVTKSIAFQSVAGSPVIVRREDVLAGGQLGRLIPAHEPVVVIAQLLEFKLVLNPGAVFGIGAGKRVVFIAFTGAALAFGLWMFARWTRAKDRWAHVGVALLLAGGLGNLYDRLVFGCVRDFIHPLPGVQIPFGLSWPGRSGPGSTELWPYVSNVADLWLIVGIGLLLIHSWFDKHTPTAQRPTSPAAPPASAA